MQKPNGNRRGRRPHRPDLLSVSQKLDGKRIEDDTVLVDALNAGQSQDFEAFTLMTSDTAAKLKNATFKILEVSKY
ncbi:MAG: hypothetical protein MJ080_03635 [Clostridia bacterium]|nr:hypothetical protein [Clostridia bacterium]